MIKVSQAATAAAVIGAGTLVACVQVACVQNDTPPAFTHATPHGQQSHTDSDGINFPGDEDKKEPDSHRNPLTHLDDSKPVSLEGEPRDGMRDSYFACIESSSSATWAIQECISAEWEFQDSRMNTAYEGLRQHLPEQQWLQIRDEQRTWLSNFESEKDCAWNSETEGQAQRIIANECSLRVLAARAAVLERLLAMK